MKYVNFETILDQFELSSKEKIRYASKLLLESLQDDGLLDAAKKNVESSIHLLINIKRFY